MKDNKLVSSVLIALLAGSFIGYFAGKGSFFTYTRGTYASVRTMGSVMKDSGQMMMEKSKMCNDADMMTQGQLMEGIGNDMMTQGGEMMQKMMWN